MRERAEAGALHERTGERAAILHGTAGALGALCGRAALYARADVGALHEQASALGVRAGAPLFQPPPLRPLTANLGAWQYNYLMFVGVDVSPPPFPKCDMWWGREVKEKMDQS